MLSVASVETKSLHLFGNEGHMSAGQTTDTIRHHPARGRPAPLSSQRESDNDISFDVKKSLLARSLLGFRYLATAVEDEYVVFLYRSRNAPIAMCGVAGVLAIGSITLDVGNIRAPFSYVTSVIAAVWLAAGAAMVLLKFQESALLSAQPQSASHAAEKTTSSNPIGSSQDFSCGSDHIANARRVEAAMVVALVANMALCCSLFYAKGNCAYSRSPRLAQRMCYDAIQIDGATNLLLILSMMLLRLRSFLVAPVLLLYLVVNIAIRFGPKAIPFAWQYFASSTIVISLQVILCVVAASILEFRSRKAFETLIRHHDKCFELQEVRARNEALAPSKLPIEAIRHGAFERSDGMWETSSTRVYFACITLRNFLEFSSQLPPLQILDIIRAFNTGVDEAVTLRRATAGKHQPQRRPRTKLIDSSPLTPPSPTSPTVVAPVPNESRAPPDVTMYDIVRYHSFGDVYMLSATPNVRRKSDDGCATTMRRDDEEFIRLIAECSGSAMCLLRPLIKESHTMAARRSRGKGHLVCVSGASSGRGGGVVLQSSKVVLPIPASSASYAMQLCREAEVVQLFDCTLPVIRVPSDWVASLGDKSFDSIVTSTWRQGECFKISVQPASLSAVGDVSAYPFSPLQRLSTANSDPIAQNPFALEEPVSESPRFVEVGRASRETELSNAVDLKRFISWFPFLKRFSDSETELLFAQECNQQSPRLFVANMVLWSAALIGISGGIYGMGSTQASSLWFLLAAFGVACGFAFCVVFLKAWVVGTHVASFIFTSCVTCAVCLAPDDTVLRSGQIVWMYVLFGISSSRPITVSPLVMWSLDGCTALAFLVNVIYHFPFDGEANDLKRFVTYITIAHFFYPLLFWLVIDDSSRESFAVHHRTVLLQGLLHDDHAQLKRAIDSMAIKGVAAELLGKSFRSKRVTQLMLHNDRLGRHAMRESNLRTSSGDCAVVALRFLAPNKSSVDGCLWLQEIDLCLSSLNTLHGGSAGCQRTVLVFGDTAVVFAMPTDDEDEIPACVSLFVDTISAISALTSFYKCRVLTLDP